MEKAVIKHLLCAQSRGCGKWRQKPSQEKNHLVEKSGTTKEEESRGQNQVLDQPSGSPGAQKWGPLVPQGTMLTSARE